MKLAALSSAFASPLVLLALVVSLVPLVEGCAGEDAESQDAQFPQTPVGYDTAAEYAQAQAQTSQSTPNPAQAQPIEGSEVDIGTPEQVADNGGGDDGEYADTDPSALTDFHNTLDPYGSWVDDGTYGTVWVPSEGVVGDDFTPYVSGGHWTYDDDYTWVSDYSWGWAPFHYGRWVYMGGTGWGWVPGRTYAGAWVSWRTGYGDWGYVGWAPMPPTYYWRGGYAYGLGHVPYASYSFCASGDLFHPGIGQRIVTGPQVGVIAGHTQPYVAHPTVGGVGHVAATPSVGGPPPGMLHIAPSAVVHSPASNPGLNQARAFSRPATAEGLGGRAPAQSFGRPGVGGGVASYGRAGPGVATYHASGYNGAYSSYRSSYGGYSSGRASTPYYAPSRYGSAPTYHASVPSKSRGRSYSSTEAPVYHSGGGYRGGGGGYHGGGFSGGGFHGGGGGGGHRR